MQGGGYCVIFRKIFIFIFFLFLKIPQREADTRKKIIAYRSLRFAFSFLLLFFFWKFALSKSELKAQTLSICVPMEPKTNVLDADVTLQ